MVTKRLLNSDKKATLQTQCESLGWLLTRCTANYIKKGCWSDANISNVPPEIIIAKRIECSGERSSWCEGGSINILMKAASLDVLAKRNIFNDRSDAVARFFEAQVTILNEYVAEITDCIRNISHDRLYRNIHEICENKLIKEFYPNVQEDFLLGLASKLDVEFIGKIFDVFALKPYDYRAGWPDITVLGENDVYFIEVKTTDILSAAQIRFATEIAKPLNLVCHVYKLN